MYVRCSTISKNDGEFSKNYIEIPKSRSLERFRRALQGVSLVFIVASCILTIRWTIKSPKPLLLLICFAVSDCAEPALSLAQPSSPGKLISSTRRLQRKPSRCFFIFYSICRHQAIETVRFKIVGQ